MRLSERQLRRIIQEEKANILAEELMKIGRLQRTRRLDEWSVKGFLDGAKNMFKEITDFKKGVETFLSANKQWIVPVYNTVAKLVNEHYGKNLKMLDENFGSIDNDKALYVIQELDIGDKDPHTGGIIVDLDFIDEAASANDPDGEVIYVFELEDGRLVEYHYSATGSTIGDGSTMRKGKEMFQQSVPKITVTPASVRESLRRRRRYRLLF